MALSVGSVLILGQIDHCLVQGHPMHCKVFSNISCLYLPAETFLPGCDNQKCISLLSNVASFLQYCLRSLKVVFCITFIEFYRHLEAIRSICCNQQFLLFLCDTAKAPAANAQCLYPTECFCLNNSFFLPAKFVFKNAYCYHIEMTNQITYEK